MFHCFFCMFLIFYLEHLDLLDLILLSRWTTISLFVNSLGLQLFLAGVDYIHCPNLDNILMNQNVSLMRVLICFNFFSKLELD